MNQCQESQIIRGYQSISSLRSNRGSGAFDRIIMKVNRRNIKSPIPFELMFDWIIGGIK